MQKDKSIVDFIYTAAARDGVTTTIRPFDDRRTTTVVIEFSKRGRRSCIGFDPSCVRNDAAEEALLFSLRNAMFDLMEYPYRNIREGAGELAESLKEKEHGTE